MMTMPYGNGAEQFIGIGIGYQQFIPRPALLAWNPQLLPTDP